jgi:hypothetical protein
MTVSPPIHCLVQYRSEKLIRYALSYVFIDSDFARRISNAMRLIQFSDAHANDAVSLAFCVSAMEALLCNPWDSRPRIRKSEQLRKRIPALLQAGQDSPDFDSSVDALYEARSRCLHGSSMSSDPELVLETRRLVAAILRATLEWAIHKSDEPQNVSADDWITELQVATAGERQPIPGVTKDLAKHFTDFHRVFLSRLKPEA